MVISQTEQQDRFSKQRHTQNHKVNLKKYLEINEPRNRRERRAAEAVAKKRNKK